MKHILIYMAMCLTALYACSGKRTGAGKDIPADTIPMMLTAVSYTHLTLPTKRS